MRRAAILLALGLLTSACVRIGGDAPTPAGLVPTFDPASPTSSAVAGSVSTPEGTSSSRPTSPTATATATDASPSPPVAVTAGPTERPSSSPETASSPPSSPAPPRTAEASVADPPDDHTVYVTGAPPWADLAAGVLTRTGAQVTLAIALGAAVPTAAPDGDHTMNVASFYDLDGDGSIDVEVWANLSDGGWDTSSFDDRTGTAAYSGDDEVDVAVEHDRLVLRFPASLLDGAWSFRWAVASEYGRYEELGTSLTARDDMPDDDGAVRFPGG